MQIILTTLCACLIFFSQACTSKKSLSTQNPTSDNSNQEVHKEDNKKTYPIAEYTSKNNLSGYEQAILAGGCFWCTEAAFERIEGVVDVLSGYSGGHLSYPTYSGVGAGGTGHAEAIYIYYDKSVITYEQLLDVFFVAHDPTTLNRQGPDAGEEYRSAIFFQSEQEQKIIDSKIKALNASDTFQDKIVTQVAPYDEFWVAEGYHQNYYELNPNHGYVLRVSKPKVLKVMKAFPDMIKAKYQKS